jgi:hypothetical protein
LLAGLSWYFTIMNNQASDSAVTVPLVTTIAFCERHHAPAHRQRYRRLPHPLPLARFWGEALDYEIADNPDSRAVTVEDPRDRDVEIVFVPAPESKTVKNRVHLGLGANDRAPQVGRLEIWAPRL